MSDPIQVISNKVFSIRAQRVMLDRDAASLYGVSVHEIHRAIKRKRRVFPDNSVFRLTKTETIALGSILASRGIPPLESAERSYALTEVGVLLLATVLCSRRAIDAHIAMIRAVVR